MNNYSEKFEKMRIAGNLAAKTLDMLTENIKEGVTTSYIDKTLANLSINQWNDKEWAKSGSDDKWRTYFISRPPNGFVLLPPVTSAALQSSPFNVTQIFYPDDVFIFENIRLNF